MVLTCCAVGCKQTWTNKERGITFHRFPIDEKRRIEWTKALRRENFRVSNSTKICSRHFTEECFERLKFGGTWLKPNAIPTIFDFSTTPSHGNERKKRLAQGDDQEDNLAPTQSPFPANSLEEGEIVFGTESFSRIGPAGLCRVNERSFFQPGGTALNPCVDKSSTEPCKDKYSFFGRRDRKYFLGDFNEEDMKCEDKAISMLQIAKDIVRSKTRSIKILKRACTRYENQIGSLTEKLRRAKKRRERPQSKKSEATSVNQDVSANLELELTSADSICDQEMTIKEEPMSESEESGTSGYQEVYHGIVPTDSVARPGVSATVTPSVVSVTSLAKPSSSGEILGMPIGDGGGLLGPPPSQNVSEDKSDDTNGVLEKKPILLSSLNEAAGDAETKVLPDYRTRDQFDVYGEYIASKLRRLDWRTCAHVQKAFGDIIFQAEMGKFTVPEV